jgi:putative oxidoreductase
MMERRAVVGWTLVRICFGLSLSLAHGVPKLLSGAKNITATVAAMGLPFPPFFAWCATLAELVGGLLIAAGLFARPAALFASFTMMVALYQHRADPFSKMEKALLFFTVCAAVTIAGAGPWSLDAKLRRRP